MYKKCVPLRTRKAEAVWIGVADQSAVRLSDRETNLPVVRLAAREN
jgi:hypothetical protein